MVEKTVKNRGALVKERMASRNGTLPIVVAVYKIRVAHLQRPENASTDEVLERAARSHLDDGAKQDIADIAVCGGLSRLICKSAVEMHSVIDQRDLIDWRLVVSMYPANQINGPKVFQSRRMVQQLADRDFGYLIRTQKSLEPRQILGCRIVETDLPILDKLHDGCGGEELGQGPKMIDVIDGCWPIRWAVGKTEGFGVGQDAVFHSHHTERGWRFICNQSVEMALHDID